MAAHSAALTITTSLPLPDSTDHIPILGFGTYESPPGDVCYTSCLAALRAGYRHIDTAQFYANEAAVGRAIIDSGIPRNEVFVTSKVLFPGDDLDSTYAGVVDSVRKISTGKEEAAAQGAGDDRGYIDLFLVHSPNGGRQKRKLMWKALEKAKSAGLVKSIGVSNYGVPHIEEMKEYAATWPPAVNQIELHPWCQQRNCTSYCRENNILIEAYCPIVRNQKANDPLIQELSKKCDKTPSQILIRWALEKGFLPLPKSDTPTRIEENAGVFGWVLDETDIASLDGLDRGRTGSIVQAVEGD